MDRKIRVRFAPSPTGPLHMGGVRTALYNYLFAKKAGGDFILRIEDTDQNRFVNGSEEYIIEALKWAGIIPNEGIGFGDGPCAPYRQSERKEIYKQYAEKLVAEGKAYYAFDSPEQLEEIRLKVEAAKETFSYNSISRQKLTNSLTLSADEVKNRLNSNQQYVVRIQVPSDEELRIKDIIRGWVSVHSSQLDDKVLFKSDGMPTYHLANVVDDYLMKITHVIRGEEWLPSAPVHLLLYRFLGWENVMPEFAHLPLLLKPDGNGKLSKRDGDRLGFPVFPINWKDPQTGEQSSGYRENGYFPEAFVNMIALLGWHTPDNQEIFSMEELIENFSLDRVSKSGAKFDPEKTKWFNQQYLKKHSDDELTEIFMKDIQEKIKMNQINADVSKSESFISLVTDFNFVREAVKLTREKIHFTNEFWNVCYYFFIPPAEYDNAFITKKWSNQAKEFFGKLKENYVTAELMDLPTTEKIFKDTAVALGLKPGEFMQLFRVLLIGVAMGPGLFETVVLLGKAEVILRIDLALQKLP